MTIVRNEFDPFRIREDVFHAGPSRRMLTMEQPHTHSQVEVNLILAGSAVYAFQGQEAMLETGDIGFFWGAFSHQTIRVAPETMFVCIYVPIEMFIGLRLDMRLYAAVLAGGLIVAGRRTDDAAARLEVARLEALHEELIDGEHELGDLSRAEMELCLRRIDRTGWRDLMRPDAGPGQAANPSRSAGVVAMIRFMSTNSGQPIAVSDIAAAAGLHPNYAMTVFRQGTGMTIGGFLTRCRLHKAQELLLTTARDMTSVAIEAGFNSPSRFYDAFGRHVGLSPRQFRLAAAPQIGRMGRSARQT